jgi:NAD(P)-dependent dehydrogenase (short-subunit alcohol dehydrogenase family)
MENNMIKTFDLSGKIVLITGGYGHLGKAITDSLAQHGARVYVLARDKNKFDEAFGVIGPDSEKIRFAECDIASTESIQSAFESVIAKEGVIDVLINNAFYLSGKDPFSMTDDQWSESMDGTLNSVFRCIREVIPFIRKSKSGRIINVASMYGMVAPDVNIYNDNPEMLNPPNYGAAKAGVIQLTKYYAGLLGPEGITVNVVSPGPFPSPKVQEKTGFIGELNKRTMLGRIGKPEELAGIFVYLASDASGFMTGQNLPVDGGWTAR